MDKEELKRLIAGGETLTVELKRNAPWSAEIAQRLCGFANSPAGGMLVLGVEDQTWQIKGIENPAGAIDEVLRGAAAVSPPVPLVEADPQVVELDGYRLVIARVPPNTGLLYQASGAYWLRRGTQTRPMTTAQVAEYMHRQGLVVWESQPNPTATLDDLDMKRVEGYLQHLAGIAGRPSRLSDPAELLVRLECAVWQNDPASGQSVLRPTNVGLLLFGEAPRYFYPQAEIICTYYRDDSGLRRYDDRRIIAGTLTGQIDEAFAFVKLYTPVAAQVVGLNRVDLPQLPLESLREAIVNAVVHRDYSLRGEAIRIFYYANRLEIHNPGLLVPGLRLEDLAAGRSRSKPRNPILASILRDMPGNYLERVGTGIPFMLNQMRQAGLPDPQFREQGEFVLTLWNTTAQPPTITASEPLQVPMQSEQPARFKPVRPPSAPATVTATDLTSREARQQIALEEVRRQGYITNREYQKLTGASESTATRDLEILVERGNLRRTGRGPSRRYIL